MTAPCGVLTSSLAMGACSHFLLDDLVTSNPDKLEALK
jgi:hypothetical protein